MTQTAQIASPKSLADGAGHTFSEASPLLIPQGAKLIGQYDNSVAFGQSRVLLV